MTTTTTCSPLPVFSQLPLEVVWSITELLDWNSIYSLAATCPAMWKTIGTFRFPRREFIFDHQKLDKLKQTCGQQSFELRNCLIAKICTTIVFKNTECNIPIMYILSKAFSNAIVMDVSSLKYSQENIRTLLQIFNKVSSNCIIKTDKSNFNAWTTINDSYKYSTISIARSTEELIREKPPESLMVDTPKVIDLYKTPPHLTRHFKLLKDDYKWRIMEYGGLELRFESTFPKSLADFTKGRGYMELDNAVLGPVSHTLLPTETDLIEAKLERVGRKFAECVILSGTNWILVTQWDVFISNSPLDNCAYHVKDLDMTGFAVSIMSKKEGKGTWNELIIQNGEYQLLALGGIICENGNCKPFLGSSIPTSQSSFSNPTCHVLMTTPDVIPQCRYLRDYAKMSANLKASFLSTRFSSLGFLATHPLSFGHPVSGNTISLALVGSRILASYVSRKTKKEDVADCLSLLKRNTIIAKMIQDTTIMTVEELYNKFESEIKTTGALTKVVIQKLYIMETATEITSPINMLLVDNDDYPKLRDIVNSGLAEAIKNCNKLKVKKFAQNHLG